MAGGSGSRLGRSVVAVERCGKQPRYNEEQHGRSLRSCGETAFEKFHLAPISLPYPNDVKS